MSLVDALVSGAEVTIPFVRRALLPDPLIPPIANLVLARAPLVLMQLPLEILGTLTHLAFPSIASISLALQGIRRFLLTSRETTHFMPIPPPHLHPVATPKCRPRILLAETSAQSRFVKPGMEISEILLAGAAPLPRVPLWAVKS